MIQYCDFTLAIEMRYYAFEKLALYEINEFIPIVANTWILRQS